MSGLSDGEREALYSPLWETGCHGFMGDHPELETAVEVIVTAREKATEERVRAEVAAEIEAAEDHGQSGYVSGNFVKGYEHGRLVAARIALGTRGGGEQ